MKISHTIWSMVRTNEWSGRFCLTTKLGLTSFCVTIALLLTGGTLRGQGAIEINGTNATDEITDSNAPYVIFSNIGSPQDAYNNTTFFPTPIVGQQVNQMTEQWDAVRFVPPVDVQASLLEAAVQYVAGTPSVQLSIYDSSGLFGTPGAPLPGAQGTTADIPDSGECCQLAMVTLYQPVTLFAHTIYWLVASPGSKDFNGVWRASHLGERAFFTPSTSWVLSPGEWPAARVRGAKVRALGPVSVEKQQIAPLDTTAATGRVIIFSNLNSTFPQPYIPGIGLPVIGNDVDGYGEEWEALPFTPKTDVQATMLKAAVAHDPGYPTVIDLGIYSDSGGLPGAPLSGGQGTATNLPFSGDCCDFATARLPGAALSHGVQYWLVVSPNAEAEKFMGIWRPSTNNDWAVLLPEQSSIWTVYTGDWMAAQISGRNN
jgi:hypothetical protein